MIALNKYFVASRFTSLCHGIKNNPHICHANTDIIMMRIIVNIRIRLFSFSRMKFKNSIDETNNMNFANKKEIGEIL